MTNEEIETMVGQWREVASTADTVEQCLLLYAAINRMSLLARIASNATTTARTEANLEALSIVIEAVLVYDPTDIGRNYPDE